MRTLLALLGCFIFSQLSHLLAFDPPEGPAYLEAEGAVVEVNGIKGIRIDGYWGWPPAEEYTCRFGISLFKKTDQGEWDLIHSEADLTPPGHKSGSITETIAPYEPGMISEGDCFKVCVQLISFDPFIKYEDCVDFVVEAGD